MIYVFLVIPNILFSSEIMFQQPFKMIAEEQKKIEENRAELASNFDKLRNLSARNSYLESQIAELLQYLSKSHDFNTEVQITKAKNIEIDINNVSNMHKGYKNINSEIEKTWKISK